MSLSVRLANTCPYCSASIPPNAAKCTVCGALIPTNAPAPALGAPQDDQTRGALNAEALRVLQTDGKIHAIKFIRERTGFGLKQAKDYVDVLETARDPGPAAVLQSKAGCGTAAGLAVIARSAAVLWRLLFA